MKISWGAIITFISLLIITVSALVGIFTILNILFTLPLLADVVLTAIPNYWYSRYSNCHRHIPICTSNLYS